MANEELIYRITRAIYARLGPAADESTVEQLVTDIYQTVAPALIKNGNARDGPLRKAHHEHDTARSDFTQTKGPA